MMHQCSEFQQLCVSRIKLLCYKISDCDFRTAGQFSQGFIASVAYISRYFNLR